MQIEKLHLSQEHELRTNIYSKQITITTHIIFSCLFWLSLGGALQ